MRFSRNLKMAAAAGLFGFGFVVAATSPALAHRAYTSCDRDGDRCWRVVCDNDGDDCRTYRMNTDDYGYRWRRDYGRGYDRDYYRNYYRGYTRGGYRYWICDRDGDDCHWSYGRW